MTRILLSVISLVVAIWLLVITVPVMLASSSATLYVFLVVTSLVLQGVTYGVRK